MGKVNTYEGLTDELLMKQYAGGDSGSLGEIYDRYHRRLLHYFYRMLWQDREKAEDFMQELFLKLANKPESFDTSRPFKTWIFSIAHNMCKNEYKKREIHTRVHEDIRLDGEPVFSGVAGSSYDNEQFATALEKEINLLEEPQRSTFLLRFREELQIKEIAGIMDVSEGTVKSRIFYTLKKLSERLKAFDPKLQYDGIRNI